MVGEISREEMDRLMGWVEMSDANRAFFQKVSGDDAWKERYARYRKIDEKGIFDNIEIGKVDSNPYLAGNAEKDQISVKPARMLQYIQIPVIFHVNDTDIISDIDTV